MRGQMEERGSRFKGSEPEPLDFLSYFRIRDTSLPELTIGGIESTMNAKFRGAKNVMALGPGGHLRKAVSQPRQV